MAGEASFLFSLRWVKNPRHQAKPLGFSFFLRPTVGAQTYFRGARYFFGVAALVPIRVRLPFSVAGTFRLRIDPGGGIFYFRCMEPFQPRSVRLRSGNACSSLWLRTCLLPTACCLLAVGCNSGKQLQRDLVQRELRLQEDEIYRLEDYLETYQQKVRSLRKENSELKQQLAVGGDSTAAPGASGTRDDNRLPASDDPLSNNDEEQVDKGFVPPEVPSIDFGTPTDPPVSPDGDYPVPPGNDAPPFQPPTSPATSSTLPEEVVAPLPTANTPLLEPLRFAIQDETAKPIGGYLVESPPVQQPLATIQHLGIQSEPGPPEPDGQATVIVRVIPEQANGKPLAFRGEASVMLRTAAAEQSPQVRVARWDYSSAEVTESAVESADGTMPLEFLVGLPANTPAGESLELWVRLVDAAGNKALGQAPFSIPVALAAAPTEPEPPVVSLAEVKTSEPPSLEPLPLDPLPLKPVPLKPVPLPKDLERGTFASMPELLSAAPAVSEHRLATPTPLATTPLAPLSAAKGVKGVKQATWTSPAILPATPPKPAQSWQLNAEFGVPQSSTSAAVATQQSQDPQLLLPIPANPWDDKSREKIPPRPLDPGFSFEP